MNAMEEKKCSPSSGAHHSPVPMQQPNHLDLSANSFGLHQQLLQQQQQLLQLQRPNMHHRHLTPNFAAAPDAARRPGIPPLSPYSQMPPRSPSSSSTSAPLHARSLSQPAFFSLDSLPPLSPAPQAPPSPAPTSMHLPSMEFGAPAAPEDRLQQQVSSAPTGLSSLESGGRLPPRKAHRRSQSDIPFGVAATAAAGFLYQPPPMSSATMADPATGLPLPQRSRQQQQLVKKEFSDWEKEADNRNHDGGDVGDDLISAYMNLDNLETLHSCETEERREYMNGSRLSGTRTSNTADSSENEAESSSVNDSSGGGNRKEGNKRSAAGDLMPMNSRHLRSLSMDSMMSKLNFVDESPRFPPSVGNPTGQLSRSGSMDGATASMLNLEFGNGEFNSAELKKIVANEKLAEMALTDPKRVKRILANRQSAARSKERKMRYISELEHKVQTLQTEATTLSAQLTLLQRDSAGLTSQNNELKFRIQSMEQQAQLRDALNQALNAEVHRLKLATGEITEAQLSKNMNQQMHMSSQVFQHNQFQSQQQPPQASWYQLQMPEKQQEQNNVTSKAEEKKCKESNEI